MNRKVHHWGTLAATMSAIAALCVLATARLADAATRCAQWELVEAQLGSRYGDRRESIGVLGDQRVLVLMATPDGSTWTLLVVDTNSVACIVADGVDWVDGTPPVRPHPRPEPLSKPKSEDL